MSSLIEPKVLKGFRDSLPETAIPRQRMIRDLEECFASFGFAPIDTPALEYSEILLGKGSEETDKQMYRFVDNGGRDIALRFDLTVPLARFAAAHVNELGTPFKRYHIAPVWRAEKPQRGRYREFIQCDFDIIGTRSTVADAEILALVHYSLSKLQIAHRLRVNNRMILNGVLETISARERSTSVLRAIDKLEKQGPDVVRAELETEAGLTRDQVALLFTFLEIVKHKGSEEEILSAVEHRFGSSETVAGGVKQLRETLHHARTAGISEEALGVDLSIARGLDYYTGLVFETTLLDLPQIGSICSGGRYDNLASLYSKQDLPGVGGSVGLDRILGAFEELDRLSKRSSTADVLVTLLDPQSVEGCLKIASGLRKTGFKVEVFPEIGKLGNQLKYASRKGIPAAIIAGETELSKNACAVKNMATGEQSEIAFGELETALKRILG